MPKALEIIAQDAKNAARGAAKGILHASYFPILMTTSLRNTVLDPSRADLNAGYAQPITYGLMVSLELQLAIAYVHNHGTDLKKAMTGLGVMALANVLDLGNTYYRSVKERANPPENIVQFAKPEADKKSA